MAEIISLSRIVSELTQNSIDAGCTQIDIVIKVSKADKYLYEIEIKDDGIITGEVDEFFDRGYSTKNSSGIGLSLIKDYVIKHDGEIFIKRLENNTVVRLKFKTDDIIKLDHFDEILYTLSINFDIRFKYIYDYEFNYDTKEINCILKDVSIKEFRVMNYLMEYIREGLNINYNK